MFETLMLGMLNLLLCDFILCLLFEFFTLSFQKRVFVILENT